VSGQSRVATVRLRQKVGMNESHDGHPNLSRIATSSVQELKITKKKQRKKLKNAKDCMIQMISSETASRRHFCSYAYV